MPRLSGEPHRIGYRRITMTNTPRRTRSASALVAGLVLAAGLTACGSDDGGEDTATDPAPSSSTPSPSEETPSDEPTESVPSEAAGGSETISAIGSAGVTEATMVSATEGGGTASTLAFALDTDQAVADFVMELSGGLAETVTSAVADVAQQSPGSTPYGATVAIGCDPPRRVAIEAGEAGFEVIPKLPKKGVQCLAPVTYVVLFSVPDA